MLLIAVGVVLVVAALNASMVLQDVLTDRQ
jgi:hypothetical protein